MLVENNSTSGATISTVVPSTWAMKWAARDGRRSRREVAVVRPLDPLERHAGAVADHRRDDVGEVFAELRDAGTDPHHDDQQLQRDDHVHERQHGEEDQRRQVLLTPRSEEDGLVAQTVQHQQHDRRDQQRRVDQPGCVVRQGLSTASRCALRGPAAGRRG